MICCPQSMEPSQTHDFACNGIEVVSATSVLPNASHVHIVLVYRSPSVPLQTLITFLSQVLDRVSVFSIPSVVLGDFNENVLSGSDSQLIDLMSSYGYSQLVQSPTTAQGTLLDHVYCNNSSIVISVQVQDTYYSDHDTVFCCIQL